MKTVFRLSGRILCCLICFVLLLSSSSVSLLPIAAAVQAAPVSIDAKCKTADGNTYKVTVSFTDAAGIPQDARLRVNEISASDERYDEYLRKTESVLDTDCKDFSFTRLLDITITDKNDADRIYQPLPDTSVNVQIRMTDADALTDQDVKVIHFAG